MLWCLLELVFLHKNKKKNFGCLWKSLVDLIFGSQVNPFKSFTSFVFHGPSSLRSLLSPFYHLFLSFIIIIFFLDFLHPDLFPLRFFALLFVPLLISLSLQTVGGIWRWDLTINTILPSHGSLLPKELACLWNWLQIWQGFFSVTLLLVQQRKRSQKIWSGYPRAKIKGWFWEMVNFHDPAGI